MFKLIGAANKFKNVGKMATLEDKLAYIDNMHRTVSEGGIIAIENEYASANLTYQHKLIELAETCKLVRDSLHNSTAIFHIITDLMALSGGYPVDRAIHREDRDYKYTQQQIDMWVNTFIVTDENTPMINMSKVSSLDKHRGDLLNGNCLHFTWAGVSDTENENMYSNIAYQAWMYDASVRIDIRPAKLIAMMNRLGALRRMYDDKEINAAVEFIMTQWKRDVSVLYTFEIEDDVKAVYDAAKEDSNVYSCMASDERPYASSALEYWSEIGVKAVRVTRDGLTVGRALLFPDMIDMSTGNTVTYLDRCYPNDSQASAGLKIWAERKGYAFRKHDGASMPLTCDAIEHNLMFVYDDNTVGHYDPYPWGDTFDRLVALSDGRRAVAFDSDIVIQNYPGSRLIAIFADSSYPAEDEGGNTGYCENCHESFPEDDGCYVYQDSEQNSAETWCESCRDMSATQHNGEYYNEDIIVTLSNGDTAFSDDAEKCCNCEEYFTEEEVITASDDECYCMNCAVKSEDDGVWYSKIDMNDECIIHFEFNSKAASALTHKEHYRRAIDILDAELSGEHPDDFKNWTSALRKSTEDYFSHGFMQEITFYLSDEDGDGASADDAYTRAIETFGLHEYGGARALYVDAASNTRMLADIAAQERLYDRYLELMGKGLNAEMRLIAESINSMSIRMESKLKYGAICTLQSDLINSYTRDIEVYGPHAVRILTSHSYEYLVEVNNLTVDYSSERLKLIPHNREGVTLTVRDYAISNHKSITMLKAARDKEQYIPINYGLIVPDYKVS